MTDFVDSLTDAELRTKLAEYGFPVVPITTTTRKVMAKKLKMLIENKNKINNEGRRSLAKYSSEEESDEEVKSRKKENRRITVAVGMLPPVSKVPRKSTRSTPVKEDRNISQQSTPPKMSNVSIATESKTRRTTRIVKPVPEDDLEIGSDSEPEIVDEYENPPQHEQTSSSRYSTIDAPKLPSAGPKPSFSYLSSRSPLNQSTTTSRYTTITNQPHNNDLDNLHDRVNQIRSRLSLGSHDNYNTGTGDIRKIDQPSDTPFLSNFSKRLSQLSNTSPILKTDYNFKNDIIKEHDTNGSSYTTRTYLNRLRNRDFPSDFKSSQEKNIFKNNIVSFTLVGILVAFFIAITLMYFGIRTEQSITDKFGKDYIIPICEETKNPKAGLNCILDQDKTNTLNLLSVLIPEVNKRVIDHHCNDFNIKSYMTEEDIINFVTKNYALQDPYIIRNSVNNLQFLICKNPKWGLSVIKLNNEEKEDNTALESIEEATENGVRKKLGITVLNPNLPLKCVFYNKMYTIFMSCLVILIGFFAVFGGQKGYKYYKTKQKLKNDQIYSMVEKIIDILQTNATENSENFMAVNHVRDMLIPPQERKMLCDIWNLAVKFLQENESRVRTEIQIVSGEEFHVWRWLGTNLNSTSSPRSKSWQGQAFETQVGSVNSLPCSPTPCLKIRGMFDERERNFFTVREAVLNKCASKCKILHCEADMSSGCVYLKCANQAEAAIAYQNLHGWWYDGHLVTVKYLRLERYMQRFPSSPVKGPPYLTASSTQSVENDWTTNDD